MRGRKNAPEKYFAKSNVLLKRGAFNTFHSLRELPRLFTLSVAYSALENPYDYILIMIFGHVVYAFLFRKFKTKAIFF